MKLVPLFLLLLLLVMPSAVQAADNDIQADILMAKIKPLLKADKAAEALPYMAELERLGPSLSKPLPESFYFYYIDSLDKSGDLTNALSRADAYLHKYGRKGLHYSQVLEIVGKLQMQTAATGRKNAGEFVSIPGGCFDMGCGGWFRNNDWPTQCGDDEKPVHEVCLRNFGIGKYEITQGQWKNVMGRLPLEYYQCRDDCPEQRDNVPVIYVSWKDVQEFIGKLNSQSGQSFRLPTEAEWEYACRSGGHNELYCGGNDADAVAWYFDNSGNKPHPVGTKRPNGLGIYDLSGNAAEWVGDRDGAYPDTRQQDPTGSSSGLYHVYRGGSYNVGNWNSLGMRGISSTLRLSNNGAYSTIGFRLASPID